LIIIHSFFKINNIKGFGKNNTVGQVLISLGGIEKEIGDNSKIFEEKIKETWIKKLDQYINVDINNANHIKRVNTYNLLFSINNIKYIN